MSALPPKPRAIRRIPQEIWDVVMRNMSSISAGRAAHVLRFKIRPNQQHHVDFWKSIFKDETWLIRIANEFDSNPIFIGRDLKRCLRGKFKSSYLTLVAESRNWLENLTEIREALLYSLRSHTFNEAHMEVRLTNGLRIGIGDVYQPSRNIPVRLGKLLGYKAGNVATSYLQYMDDGPIAREIVSPDIVGIGGRAISLIQVKKLCGLTITLRDGYRKQYLFEKRDIKWHYDDVLEIMHDPETHHVEGWKVERREEI
ncbi:hypothetical protein ACLMJK_001356 [Lecanora helva]